MRQRGDELTGQDGKARAGLLPEGAGSRIELPGPLPLDGGGTLPGVTVAYDTYGTLDAERGNAVLVCHPLTADQFAARDHPVTGKPGWWSRLIGPGRVIDTDRMFVVCPNVLGGCMGSTGPASAHPDGGAYGLRFPVVTVADMVRAQAGLLDALGIDRLLGVVGGSMGGMQALAWATQFPDRAANVAIIASAARHTPQNIAFHEVGRQAVMADPDWRGGDYAPHAPPRKGLAVARMAAHVTYLSEAALEAKFGRGLQDRAAPAFRAGQEGFEADFQVESYLRHQGASFTDRFDANSYLYITRAMDYFDLGDGAALSRALSDSSARFLIASFTSDWLYPTPESRRIVRALHGAGARVSFVELDSDAGHDAFLLPNADFEAVLGGFLASAADEAGL